MKNITLWLTVVFTLLSLLTNYIVFFHTTTQTTWLDRLWFFPGATIMVIGIIASIWGTSKSDNILYHICLITIILCLLMFAAPLLLI